MESVRAGGKSLNINWLAWQVIDREEYSPKSADLELKIVNQRKSERNQNAGAFRRHEL